VSINSIPERQEILKNAGPAVAGYLPRGLRQPAIPGSPRTRPAGRACRPNPDGAVVCGDLAADASRSKDCDIFLYYRFPFFRRHAVRLRALGAGLPTPPPQGRRPGTPSSTGRQPRVVGRPKDSAPQQRHKPDTGPDIPPRRGSVEAQPCGRACRRGRETRAERRG
jgi:hypothetical protein